MTSNDSALDDLLAEFLDVQGSGRKIEFEEWVGQYPQLQDQLRRLYSQHCEMDSTDRILSRLARRSRVSSRYSLEEEVARGGMGAILRVWDEDLRRNLAMKVLLNGGTNSTAQGSSDSNRKMLERLLEEAQITGQLDHPGIVPVHELGIDSAGGVYFTMRLVKGQTLSDVFELVKEERDGWNQTRALAVILKVCETMSYAHSKGVIHRDLKPSNIMVGRFGEVYVMDWGIAKVIGQAEKHDLRPDNLGATKSLRTELRDEREDPNTPLVTLDGTVIGTPAYMSPEQARGEVDSLDARTDVYAIGAMLYQLLAARMPYVPEGVQPGAYAVWRWVLEGPPEPLKKLSDGKAPELVAISERAMSRSQSERYADVSALAQDLVKFQERRSVTAFKPSLANRIPMYWRLTSRVGRFSSVFSAIAWALWLMWSYTGIDEFESWQLAVLSLIVAPLLTLLLGTVALVTPGSKVLPAVAIVAVVTPGFYVMSMLIEPTNQRAIQLYESGEYGAVVNELGPFTHAERSTPDSITLAKALYMEGVLESALRMIEGEHSPSEMYDNIDSEALFAMRTLILLDLGRAEEVRAALWARAHDDADAFGASPE